MLNEKMLDNTVGRVACPRRNGTIFERFVEWYEVGQSPMECEFFKPKPVRRGQATRPTVLTDHFPFNEPRMIIHLSERINPFPTNLLYKFQFDCKLSQADKHNTENACLSAV